MGFFPTTVNCEFRRGGEDVGEVAGVEVWVTIWVRRYLCIWKGRGAIEGTPRRLGGRR